MCCKDTLPGKLSRANLAIHNCWVWVLEVDGARWFPRHSLTVTQCKARLILYLALYGNIYLARRHIKSYTVYSISLVMSQFLSFQQL